MKLKIGIFDSGIGGFTILNSLLKTRKDVEVFYLADTKRIPFGSKNFEEIRIIAKEICNFFVDKNLDALLVACNTTNACALDILEDNLTYQDLIFLFRFRIQILDILADIFSYSLF